MAIPRFRNLCPERRAELSSTLRRRILIVSAAWLALDPWLLPSAAHGAPAASYPDRPIHIVVPFAAGTQLDLVARIVGAKLAEAVAQPVVIENRPGASGNIGSELVAKSPADGYTLLMTGSLITLLPSTLGSSAVDPVVSFAAICKVAKVPLVILVHPSLNVSTLSELVALALRQPGKIAYATMGVGSAPHVSATILAQGAGVELLHVPYVNSGQALQEVLSGEPPVYFAFRGPIDAYVLNGQLKPLAVVGSKRMRTWPDVPSVAELGYEDAAVDPWNGVLAPAGTPPDVVARLNREFVKIMNQPDVQERFTLMGLEPMTTTPELFSADIRESVVRWRAFVKAMGIRPTP
jgi:tripartite-type tricarboxylate transporter receptor subunit TctC